MDTTTELKAGDTVENRYGELFTDGGKTATVDRIADDGRVWLDHGTWTFASSLVHAQQAEGVPYDTDQTGGTAYPPLVSDEVETLEELEAMKPDLVNKPAHYAKWVIEPITFIMRNGFEFWRGNVVKYVSRAGYKLYEGQDAVQSEITDLKKVMRYAEMRINQLNGETEL